MVKGSLGRRTCHACTTRRSAEVAEALGASRWDLAATAARLHISRTSLYLVLQRHPRLRHAACLWIAG
ncbi:hypothetical protein [Sorangium sp. So ce1182]|uniref:hypothetical protein n=1 Tax=Sorangium sp. So ce1182 TaxID=3133334 RepID=UPI003F604F9D